MFVVPEGFEPSTAVFVALYSKSVELWDYLAEVVGADPTHPKTYEFSKLAPLPIGYTSFAHPKRFELLTTLTHYRVGAGWSRQ